MYHTHSATTICYRNIRSMNIRILFTVISMTVIIFLISGRWSPVHAECGSYFSYAPDTCVNAENYNVISPHVLCSGLQNICCSTQTECAALITPTTPPINTPPPGNSMYDCGTVWAPGGNEQCLDSVGNRIYPYLRCGTQNSICCKSRDVCPTYRCGNTPGECVYDPDNGFYYEDECIEQRLCGVSPAPSGTPVRFQYQPCPNNGIKTGLGCIPTNPSAFIAQLMVIGIGMGGGIAFLLILLGGFKVIMSQGNPESIAAGKDTITSAIAGLLLIIFSVFILRLVGVNLLQLPGFG